MRNALVITVLLSIVATAGFARGGKEAGDLIGPQEAWEMVQAGDAVMIDVRDEASYVEAHIAGALLVPLGQVGAFAEPLAARGRTLITYCSCPAEETSIAAASELIARGVDDVLVLRGGIRGWALENLPLRSGSRP
ncbi:MAG: rhodanese-like domain-containing protein [Spirochaetota bacterium]